MIRSPKAHLDTATKRARKRLIQARLSSKRVLAESSSDKFLRTQEPLPDEVEKIEGYLNSKELQPPE